MGTKTRRLVALSIVGLSACSSITEPARDEAAPLQTNRLSYGFSESNGFFTSDVIELVITNTSTGPAFLTRAPRTPELLLEGLEGGVWVSKYSQTVADGGGRVARLEPGESAVFETTIEGFLPGACQCSPIISFTDGVYRLRIAQGYVDSFDEEFHEFGNELPLEFRVSNLFALDAP